jgi:hypothetical protein
MGSATVVVHRDDLARHTTKGRSVDRAWMLAVTVVCPLLVLGVVWLLSGFGVNGASTAAAWVGSVVALAVIVIAAYISNRWSGVLRFGCVIASMIVLVGLVLLTVNGDIAAMKLRFDEPQWQRALDSLPARSIQGCETLSRGITFAGFGQISRVCAFAAVTDYPKRAMVLLGSSAGTSLIFYPDSGLPPAPDECIKHISGPWWESIPIDPTEACPAGFQSEGGG